MHVRTIKASEFKASEFEATRLALMDAAQRTGDILAPIDLEWDAGCTAIRRAG